MQNLINPLDVDRLARGIANHGIAAHEDDVARLARYASFHAVAPVVAGILADRDAPEVARERAFARVVSALLRDEPAVEFTAA